MKIRDGLARIGQVLEISFAAFTARITLQSERELPWEIVAGDNVGLSDTVESQAAAVRHGLVILSWQEHIGSTIVHVLDFDSGRAYTAVTPATGGFMRLTGRIDVKSATHVNMMTTCLRKPKHVKWLRKPTSQNPTKPGRAKRIVHGPARSQSDCTLCDRAAVFAQRFSSCMLQQYLVFDWPWLVAGTPSAPEEGGKPRVARCAEGGSRV